MAQGEGGGPPFKKIDEKLLRSLAKIHCTWEEMSSIVGVSVDTLSRRYAEIINSARAEGKLSLRRYQWQMAEKENLGMLVWLGKQHLGQSEKIENFVNVLPTVTKIEMFERDVASIELGAKLIDKKPE